MTNKTTIALLAAALVASLLFVSSPASASCTGVAAGANCYGVLDGCTAGSVGVGHAAGYEWCYVSVSTGNTIGVCSNVEFVYEITCVGVLSTPYGRCVGTHTYGGDGSDRGSTCVI